MTAQTPVLTPLALEHAPLLRALAQSPRPFATKGELAALVGRDHANLNKTLKRLEAEGFVDFEATALTAAGANAVRDLERLEGGGAPPASGGGMPGYVFLPVRQLQPDPLNPRKHFDEAAIAELAESIARDGLLENLVVRPHPQGTVILGVDDDGRDTRIPVYCIVAGERRYRALLELVDQDRWDFLDANVPCKLIEISDADHRRIALVENLQRKDLRPIDEATALKELMAVTGVGTAEVAKEIGFTQRFVQQRLQLLELPEALQAKVNDGGLPIEKAREAVAIWPQLPPVKQVELREGKITVDDAKGWLRAQPKPLTARARLALAEIFDAVKARPYKGNAYYGGTEIQAVTVRVEEENSATRVRIQVDDKGEIQELRDRYLVEPVNRVYEEGVETGRHYIAFTYDTRGKLKTEIPGIEDEAKRPGILEQLREAAALYSRADGQYATPWLNGPFDNRPGIADEIAAKRAAREARDADWKAQQRGQTQQQAEAKKAAEARLKAASDLVSGLHQQVDAREQLTKLLGAIHPLPWRWCIEDASVLDANGEFVDLDAYGPVQSPVPMLMMAAVNLAAGFPSVILEESPPEDEDQDAEAADEDSADDEVDQ